MAEFLGAIQRGLGFALNAIYEVTHSYALAIVVLTVVVRAVMIPLTVKQIRSMTAMQKLAPEQKKIQQKYKQLQQKAKDRSEVQQLRLDMNREVQELFRLHGVNPLGGCFPLLAQMPVFIAMFSIMRASIVAIPLVAVLPSGSAIPADSLPRDARARGAVICRPADPATGEAVTPRAGGPSPKEVRCEGVEEKDFGRYRIGDLREGRTGAGPPLPDAGWVSACHLTGVEKTPFTCTSATGTGHLPRTGRLFADVTRDRATILGMHPGCSASQVNSADKIRTCTTSEKSAGGGQAIPYYVLIALIVGTSYYQAKQMAARATGPQAQQQQMLTRIMPVMFGFISLSIPAGANMYFLATNVWTIGQQHILLTRQDRPEQEAPRKEPKPEPGPVKALTQASDGSRPVPPRRKKRKRKKRR